MENKKIDEEKGVKETEIRYEGRRVEGREE